MQTISAELPVTLVNKLKALAQIEGLAPGKLVEALEKLVNQRLAVVLGITAGPTVTPVVVSDAPPPREDEAASGLGEVVSEEDEKADIAASLSDMDKKGPTISDQDLARDMEVSDPGKEAKADATTIRIEPGQDAESAFDYMSPRPLATRRRGAKVSPMNEFPGDTS